MNVFDLEGSITLDTSGYEKAVKEAQKTGQDLEKSLQEAARQYQEAQKRNEELTAALNKSQAETAKYKTELEKAKKAIDDASKSTEGMGDSTKETSEETADMVDNLTALRAKIDVVNAEYEETQKQIEEMRRKLAEAEKATGAVSEETKAYAKRLEEAEKQAKTLEKKLDELNKRYDEESGEADKAGKETDEYGDSAEEAAEDTKKLEKEAGKLGDTFSGLLTKIGGVAGAIKDGLVKAAKLGTAAAGAAVTAVVALVKKSVSAYGEYEQLKGGAEKIFAGMDISTIQKDADNAFKELNMSASEYYEAINLAGASFTQTMGSKKAYETARTGMLAIADFASGTGKSVDELTQKYQMITRAASSYQSIADQFSGILPQTSGDFLKQAQSAGYLKEIYDDLTDVPVAEYQEAVTKMIEKGVAAQNLSNNTLRESGETLTGSIATAKKAWEDLVVAFSDPEADLGAKIDNLVTAAEGAFSNIMPTVERAIGGITQFVEGIAPVISDKLPVMINDTFPDLLTATLTLLSSLGTAIQDTLPSVIDTIFSSLPDLLKAGTSIVDSLFEAVQGALSSIAESLSDERSKRIFINEAINLFSSIADGLVSSVDIIIDMLPDIIETLGAFIERAAPILIKSAAHIIESLADFLITDSDTVIDVVTDILSSVIGTVAEVIPDLFPKVVEAIWTLLDNLATSDLFASVADLIMPLFEALLSAAEETYPIVFEMIPKVIDDLLTTIGEYFEENSDKITEDLETMVEMVIDFLIGYIPAFGKVIWELIAFLVAGIIENLPKVYEPFKNAFEDLGEWLYDVTEKIGNWIGDVWASITGFFENLGEKLYDWKEEKLEKLDNFIQMIHNAIQTFIDNIVDKFIDFKDKIAEKVQDIVDKVKDKITTMAENAKTWGKDLIDNFVGGITENIGKVTSAVSNVADNVKDFIGFSEPDKGALSNFHTFAPDMIDLFASGIKDNANKVYDEIAALSSGIKAEISVDSSARTATAAASAGGVIINNYISLEGARIASDMDIDDISDKTVEALSEKLTELDIFKRIGLGVAI